MYILNGFMMEARVLNSLAVAFNFKDFLLLVIIRENIKHNLFETSI